ncbi:hypothetical protein O988_05180 [Pseudogymnoascus sp. VKM F-3808]|nr:hypothetical protein O988_05180 [Pseudogymnoascus sp. VKM F-3808]
MWSDSKPEGLPSLTPLLPSKINHILCTPTLIWLLIAPLALIPNYPVPASNGGDACIVGMSVFGTDTKIPVVSGPVSSLRGQSRCKDQRVAAHISRLFASTKTSRSQGLRGRTMWFSAVYADPRRVQLPLRSPPSTLGNILRKPLMYARISNLKRIREKRLGWSMAANYGAVPEDTRQKIFSLLLYDCDIAKQPGSRLMVL